MGSPSIGSQTSRSDFQKWTPSVLAQIAEPQRRQVAQISQAALRGQAQQFELVLKEVGFGGDFEWAAVVFGAADDDQRDVERFALRW